MVETHHSNRVLVTGCAGFIGANFVHHFLGRTRGGGAVVGLDKLTYAGCLKNLESLEGDARFAFARGDIGDVALVRSLLEKHKPAAIINFAAESHVDRSIHAPEAFIETNVAGTFRLLEAVKAYWVGLEGEEKAQFRFLHISTDEVYGSLGPNDPAFTEENPARPNSPYAASKASSDHLARAYHHTYGLPTLTTNCSNNYGPYQFPEKLIPLMIHHALAGKKLPVYGDGQNVRDWLFVEDHCVAIMRVLEAGRVGEVYNVGGRNEVKNLDVVHTLCDILDRLRPRAEGGSYREQITFVMDRPGHDRRYAINADKIAAELGWKPAETFTTGFEKSVRWYLEHEDWVAHVTSGAYRQWMETNYEGRVARA
ncbi:MAG: dTDP-glucose 4,6-dehydratase [Bdellovibrionales bacterium]